MGFRKGDAWLVYARQHDHALHTNLCTRSTTLEHAEKDIVALGEPQGV